MTSRSVAAAVVDVAAGEAASAEAAGVRGVVEDSEAAAALGPAGVAAVSLAAVEEERGHQSGVLRR